MKLFGLELQSGPLPGWARAGLFAAGSLALCAAVNLTLIHGELSASAAAVRGHLDADTKKVEERLTEAAERIRDQENAPRLTSTPVFIDRIGQLAAEHDVPIRSIRPHSETPDLFLVEIEARYHDFEGFIGALEELDVELVAFEAELEEQPSEDPRAVFRIQLLPNNNARTLDIPRLAELRRQIALPGRRNPFQRIDLGGDGGPNRIDLSDILRLSGISRLGDIRIATIDSKDFQVGDRVAGREVTSIENDRVLLRRDDPSGAELFVLRFRHAQVIEGPNPLQP